MEPEEYSDESNPDIDPSIYEGSSDSILNPPIAKTEEDVNAIEEVTGLDYEQFSSEKGREVVEQAIRAVDEAPIGKDVDYTEVRNLEETILEEEDRPEYHGMSQDRVFDSDIP